MSTEMELLKTIDELVIIEKKLTELVEEYCKDRKYDKHVEFAIKTFIQRMEILKHNLSSLK